MLLYDHFITAVLLHMCDRAVSPNVKLIFFQSFTQNDSFYFIYAFSKKRNYSDIVRNGNFSLRFF